MKLWNSRKKNENKYLSFASTDKNKDSLKKYTELWNKIKYFIKTIDGEQEIEYGKDLMKIKIDTADELSLNKLVNFLAMPVTISFVEDGKYYP